MDWNLVSDFTFIQFWKHLLSEIYVDWYPLKRDLYVLYISYNLIVLYAGISEMQGKKDTWHIKFDHILQPAIYLITIVNKFNYMDYNGTKNKNMKFISKPHARGL